MTSTPGNAGTPIHKPQLSVVESPFPCIFLPCLSPSIWTLSPTGRYILWKLILLLGTSLRTQQSYTCRTISGWQICYTLLELRFTIHRYPSPKRLRWLHSLKVGKRTLSWGWRMPSCFQVCLMTNSSSKEKGMRFNIIGPEVSPL